MFCTGCGEMLPTPESTFCPACGVRVPVIASSSAEPDITAPVAGERDPTRSRRRRILVVGVAVAILGAGVLILALRDHNSNPVPLVRVQLQPGETADDAIARGANLKTAACHEPGVDHITFEVVSVDGNAVSISEPCHG